MKKPMLALVAAFAIGAVAAPAFAGDTKTEVKTTDTAAADGTPKKHEKKTKTKNADGTTTKSTETTETK